MNQTTTPTPPVAPITPEELDLELAALFKLKDNFGSAERIALVQAVLMRELVVGVHACAAALDEELDADDNGPEYDPNNGRASATVAVPAPAEDDANYEVVEQGGADES